MDYSPSSKKAAGHPMATFQALVVSQNAVSKFQIINPTMNDKEPVQNIFMMVRRVPAETGLERRRESMVARAATASMRMAKTTW
jgi:hypothetical protein